MGQPHRKSYNLNIPRKICCHIFKAPFRRIKTFKDPPFCIRPPLGVCKWSLNERNVKLARFVYLRRILKNPSLEDDLEKFFLVCKEFKWILRLQTKQHIHLHVIICKRRSYFDQGHTNQKLIDTPWINIVTSWACATYWVLTCAHVCR